MYKILLATDGSEHSNKTVEEAIKLAACSGAETTVLSVAENIPVSDYYRAGMSFDEMDREAVARLKKSLEDAERNLENTARKVLEDAERRFRDKGLKIKTMLMKGHPADVICRVAEEGAFDLVMLGSRGLGGIKELLLGSVSNKVAHCAKTSVLIVK